MSRSHNRYEERHVIQNIEENLRTFRNLIDAYKATPDSSNFSNELVKLSDDLLKLKLKYHMLTERRAASPLYHAAKRVDKEFAKELESLIRKSNSNSGRVEALSELDFDIAIDLITAIKEIGKYKLSPSQLAERATEAVKKVSEITQKLKAELKKEKVEKENIQPTAQNAYKGTLFRPKEKTENASPMQKKSSNNPRHK